MPSKIRAFQKKCRITSSSIAKLSNWIVRSISRISAYWARRNAILRCFAFAFVLPRGLPRPLFLVRSASILKTAEISMAAFFRAVFF
jgi:hypothetical protein